MKRLIIICSFLLCSIGLCLYYFINLSISNNQITQEIFNLETSIEQSQSASKNSTMVDNYIVDSYYQELDNSLEKFYKMITLFINKGRLTDIKATHARIDTLMKEDDIPSLLSEISTLRSYLNSLYEIERPLLQNIL